MLNSTSELDGIGFMGHFMNDDLPSIHHLNNVLHDFSSIGVNLKITEFDVRFGEKNEFYKLSPMELKLQRDFTEDFFRLCFSIPKMEGIIMWGFWEGRHWYPSAALWDKDWNLKPNGKAWLDLVYDEWWTQESFTLETNQNSLKTRGFLGDYTVTVCSPEGNTLFQQDFTLTKEGYILDIKL